MDPRAEEAATEALLKAQAGLHGVIRELVEPRRVPVVQLGKVRVGTVPSQLQQLRESVAHGRTGAGGGGGSIAAPLNPAARDTLTEVESAVVGIHHRAYVRSGGWSTTEQHLRAIGEIVGAWTDPAAVSRVCKDLARLRDAVKALLEPDDEVPIRGELCPHCDARMVWQYDRGQGDYVQVAPLRASRSMRTVRCIGCASSWPAEFAGELIRQRAAERLVEAMHDRHARVLEHYRGEMMEQ